MSRRRARLLASLIALSAASAQAGSPQVEYILHCQGCHLPDGSGAPGAVPALGDSVGRFLMLPRGREYLIRVPGSSMSPLGDVELAAVLNWMIRRFGPAEIAQDFPPFTPAEVSSLRRPPLTEVEAMRRELIAAME